MLRTLVIEAKEFRGQNRASVIQGIPIKRGDPGNNSIIFFKALHYLLIFLDCLFKVFFLFIVTILESDLPVHPVFVPENEVRLLEGQGQLVSQIPMIVNKVFCAVLAGRDMGADKLVISALWSVKIAHLSHIIREDRVFQWGSPFLPKFGGHDLQEHQAGPEPLGFQFGDLVLDVDDIFPYNLILLILLRLHYDNIIIVVVSVDWSKSSLYWSE